jgi:predicted nuclease of predicted toxin-antitoxin system
MTRRFYKHKLLLDEGFPPRWYFPRLNQRFDVKHIKSDLRKIGLPDTEIYALAVVQNRLIVTYNAKDFRPLARRSTATGIIGVSALMPYDQIDKKLTALLTKSTEHTLQGKYTSLAENIA